MGNKMKFLFDYYQYIKDIDNLSLLEDSNMYNNFKKQSKNGHLILVEGLITTHPLSKSANIIMKRFAELNVEIEEDGELYVDGEMDELKKYLPLFNNLGYFISIYTINGTDWIKDYDDNVKPIALYLEPKYDLKIDVVPKILYHTSPIKFKNKILKIGFIPKSGNKLSKHPERIYLTDNLNIAISFGINIKNKDNTGYCIYEINGSCIENLYSDINLRDSGYYTNQNISPNCFKLIKEII